MSTAVKFAHEVLDMQKRIDELEHEVTRLRKIEADYYVLLNDSTEHGEKMMDGWLRLLLSDRINFVKPKGTPEGIPIG
jgi:hypothetical protein